MALRPHILAEDKELTKANGSKPTSELKNLLRGYINEHKKQSKSKAENTKKGDYIAVSPPFIFYGFENFQ